MFSEPYLLSPGPVNIPVRVLDAMHVPSMHHRTAAFSRILERLLKNMAAIFNTESPVLPVHATGRASMEATILNLLSPGDEIISICNGRFGIMYADLAEKHGIKSHRLFLDWEQDIDLKQLVRSIKDNSRVKALTVIHCETSTAVINDIEALGKVCRQHDILLLVDCISSLGGMVFKMDEWGVDAAVTASQKALMGATGISFVVLSDRAWEAEKHSTFAKGYFSFKAIRQKVEAQNPETPGSSPVALVAGMSEATQMIIEEGTEQVLERHRRLAEGIRAAFIAMNLKLFPDVCVTRSDTLTAVWTPEGCEPADIINILESHFNIIVKAGLKDYKKRILRIGHMGSFYNRDALILVSAFEFALNQLGVVNEFGRGISALSPYIKE